MSNQPQNNSNSSSKKPNSKPPAPTRRRARKPDGKFQGDNPATPDLNEAWEPTGVEAALPKTAGKYEVKSKVNGSSSDAGKYSPKRKVLKPTFGKVYTEQS